MGLLRADSLVSPLYWSTRGARSAPALYEYGCRKYEADVTSPRDMRRDATRGDRRSFPDLDLGVRNDYCRRHSSVPTDLGTPRSSQYSTAARLSVAVMYLGNGFKYNKCQSGWTRLV